MFWTMNLDSLHPLASDTPGSFVYQSQLYNFVSGKNCRCLTCQISAILHTKGQVCHQLNIRIYILHTPFYTFRLVLTRRICLFIKASWVGNHFLYSHDYNEWFSSITVRRNEMLVTVKGLRYQKLNEQAFRYGQVFLKRAFKSTLMFQQPQLKSRSVREYVNLLPLLPSGTNGLLSISCPNFNMDHVVTLFLC